MAVQISGNDITVPRDGSFTRNVTIGGTLTYEDVTNIDSVGLITARNGIEIGARPGVAASISVDGNMIVSGVTTLGGEVQIPDFIHHVGDNNCKFGFESGDTFAVETAGSERVRVTSDGNLGIGTITPSGLLHTHAASGTNRNYIEASAGNSFLRIKSGSTSHNSGVEFFSGSSNSANISGLGAGGLNFEVGGSERVRIESAGNVNIEKNLKVVGVCTAASFESATFSKTPTNTPAFHAWSNNVTSHPLSDSTITKVEFLNSETFDTDSAYDNSTSGTTANRFTVPTGKGGYYQISASLNFFANANDMRQCRTIVKQNTDIKMTSYNLVTGSSDGDIRHFQAGVSGILQLAAGDYIELFGYLDTEGNSQGYISNDAQGYRGNHFSAYKLII